MIARDRSTTTEAEARPRTTLTTTTFPLTCNMIYAAPFLVLQAALNRLPKRFTTRNEQSSRKEALALLARSKAPRIHTMSTLPEQCYARFKAWKSVQSKAFFNK